MLIELFAGDYLVAFDGRVVERFGHEARRFHVTFLRRAEVVPDGEGGHELYIEATEQQGTAGIVGSLDGEHVDRAGRLITAINDARERYGLSPL